MAWLILCLQAMSGWMAHRHLRTLPGLTEGTPDMPLEHVSIVVPARDEASRLPALLDSLACLDYPDYEVVVVNDASSDSTAEVARAHGARVISIAGPEQGWTGKSFACWTGAQATEGPWILFTDADTVHGPDSLRLAVCAAHSSGVGLLSLLARQRCRTFWERLLLPYAYALYFVGAGRLNRPGGNPVANGQYMLFRRDDYETIGGHAAIRDSLIEDVALARLVARSDVDVTLARGEEQLEVRMYQDLRGLWEGFSKNAVRFVTVSPRTGLPTVLASIAFSAAIPTAVRERTWLLRTALFLLPALGLAEWEREFGVPRSFALLHPLASGMFQLLALDSMRRWIMRGGTVWKGRHY